MGGSGKQRVVAVNENDSPFGKTFRLVRPQAGEAADDVDAADFQLFYQRFWSFLTSPN